LQNIEYDTEFFPVFVTIRIVCPLLIRIYYSHTLPKK